MATHYKVMTSMSSSLSSSLSSSTIQTLVLSHLPPQKHKSYSASERNSCYSYIARHHSHISPASGGVVFCVIIKKMLSSIHILAVSVVSAVLLILYTRQCACLRGTWVLPALMVASLLQPVTHGINCCHPRSSTSNNFVFGWANKFF